LLALDDGRALAIDEDEDLVDGVVDLLADLTPWGMFMTTT
jgi:hypothetical protein